MQLISMCHSNQQRLGLKLSTNYNSVICNSIFQYKRLPSVFIVNNMPVSNIFNSYQLSFSSVRHCSLMGRTHVVRISHHYIKPRTYEYYILQISHISSFNSNYKQFIVSLYIKLSNSFLIGRKPTVNFRNQHPWRHD